MTGRPSDMTPNRAIRRAALAGVTGVLFAADANEPVNYRSGTGDMPG